MLSRFCNAVLLGSLLILPATAQTVVRFDTNVGTIDMELNPTGNPNLQAHVDNFVAYVDSGRYDLTVINRAAEGFVMQMGGFQLDTLLLPSSFSDFPSVPAFDPVIVDADGDDMVDFDVTNLLNTRGTVSLALSTTSNTGTSSFFVNIGDNPTLDLDLLRFVPFASIGDMATIDLIMGLQQGVLDDGGLASADIPLLDNNRLVFVERAFILDVAAEAAALMSGVGDLSGSPAAISAALSANSTTAPPSLTVPEPPALVLAVGALVLIYIMKPSKHG